MDSKAIPQQIKDELAGFDLTLKDYKEIMDLLNQNMEKGLKKETNPQAKVKMIPSYVTKLPSGNEEGQYLALDLGGTNYRVLLVTLRKGQKPEMLETTYAIPKSIMSGDGKDLFDYIAQTMNDFIKMHTINQWPINLGFTFSFPCIQKGLASAFLIKWTKGFSAKGCEGMDVAQLLQNAINKLNLEVKVVAVVNDTVGTLTACALQDARCAVGVIVGTGTNASYVEQIDNIELYNGDRSTTKQCVINMEWGAFGEDNCLDKFRTQYDFILDQESIHKKQQIFEKMCSGMYLGELVRLILIDLVNKKLLFNGLLPETLKEKNTFHTKYISEVESDPPNLFYCTHYMLNEDLHVYRFEEIDSQIVRYVCEKVAKRAAFIIGTGIACLLNRINRNEITVGIDGSLFKFHRKFQERMTEIVHQLKNDNIKFFLRLSEDGSGKGAAAIAALAN